MFIGIYPVYTGPDNSYAVLVYHTRTSYVNIIVYLESLRNEPLVQKKTSYITRMSSMWTLNNCARLTRFSKQGNFMPLVQSYINLGDVRLSNSAILSLVYSDLSINSYNL